MTMQILGGFIAVLGIAVIAIALTVNWLFGTSGPSLPAEGFFALFVGLGIFAAGRNKPDAEVKKPEPDADKKDDDAAPVDAPQQAAVG